MSWITKIGIVELTVGVLTGWAMVYVTRTPRERRIAAGLRDARRVRQGHIELLMQGTLLTAIGVAVPSPPIIAAVLIVVFAWLAPLAFFPVAFHPEWGDLRIFRLLDNTTFAGLSIGFVWLAVAVVMR
jgi:hydroxylaminobenzene mutase